MSVDGKILLENKDKPSTQGNLSLVLNIGIFYLSMKIYEKFLIKDRSLPIEEIPFCTN